MLMSGSEMSKEVRVFFSRFNQLVFGFRKLREIEKIRGRLDCIAKDHHDFGLRPLGSVGGGRMLLTRREESHSFVRGEDVIGRDKDKEEVVGMLLDSRSDSGTKDVNFVTVVGIGGLRKTTLAQLVYNDERIKREFSLRLWVCVSDEFEMKSLLSKLLKSATNQGHDDLEMDQLYALVRETINKKRFLLVLDDVWCEDRDKWLKLHEILEGGEKGSRVLVTTRSNEVGRFGWTYGLQGLSEEDSWHLFEKMAFENDSKIDLIEIGKQIVCKCANVPLAIRVVGSLLYGQSKSMWSSFRNMDLANIQQDDKNSVMAILKLSYHRLSSSLKSCFSYCALFPKDYRIKKETLISLWMAQGFISPLQGQSIENVGEEYFRTLLQRCFFQDVEFDIYGDEIISCKLHDLMHDLAQDVSGSDISLRKITSYEKTRHIAVNDVDDGKTVPFFPGSEKLRTFFRLHSHLNLSLGKILFTKMKRLRVLDLHATGIKNLHSSIDDLLHLRYLDLSDNKQMVVLPTTLCNLVNLQTLKLDGCERIRALPREFSELVNLRRLDIYGCDGLTHMPTGMNNLTRLHRLTMFVIDNLDRDCTGKLEDLESLKNLTGSLVIKIRQESVRDVPTVTNSKYLSRLVHLTGIDIVYEFWNVAFSDQVENHDNNGELELLASLQPHPNLRVFRMRRYPGMRFPNWEMSEDLATALPSLVELCLGGCLRLTHLPLLSGLPYLKSLKLYWLDSLEFIQGSNESDDDQLPFFPTLETLRVLGLPKLKGWWSRSQDSQANHEPTKGRHLSLCAPNAFPRLSGIKIRGCPKLVSIPHCTGLVKLILYSKAVSSSFFFSCYHTLSNEMTIEFYCNDSERLPIHQEAHTRLFSTLHTLKLSSWPKLSSLSELRLNQLTGLQELQLCNLDSLEEMEDYNFNQNLQTLKFSGIPKMANLPQGVQYCTALKTLEIYECQSLELLPEWIGCLKSLQCLRIRQCNGLKSLPDTIRGISSLREIEIEDCRGLTERCRAPSGDDWHKIEHVSYVSIREVEYGSDDQSDHP